MRNPELQPDAEPVLSETEWELAEWMARYYVAPLGLVLLGGYSLAIELIQLEVARIDRACDVTDLVDNVTGAAIGFAIGAIPIPLLFSLWTMLSP